MTYVLIGWISVSIGFILGAAWAGLGIRNKQVDHQLAGKQEEFYSSTPQNSLRS